MAKPFDQPGPADLAATPIIDADHPVVRAFAEAHRGTAYSRRRQALNLYLAARDRIGYDPYRIRLDSAGLCASQTLAQGYGWCIPKAALLAALCRCCGIPARVGFADVRNHLSTRRLRELLKTDVYYWHSYTAIFLEGRWLKATPAFDARLCARLGLPPLEFDGHSDSIFQAFGPRGELHMEYVGYRGEFSDVPLSEIIATFNREYPGFMELAQGSFLDEIDQQSAMPRAGQRRSQASPAVPSCPRGAASGSAISGAPSPARARVPPR